MPPGACAIEWKRNRILRVGKNSGPILSHLWTTVHKIFEQCREPLVISNAVADCLCRVLFRRYSPLSLDVVEKPNKCKSFWPIFSGKDDPNFSTAHC